jgi:hypothetical protein
MAFSFDCKDAIWFSLSLICWALNVLASSSCSFSISVSVSLICASDCSTAGNELLAPWFPDWALMGSKDQLSGYSLATIWRGRVSVVDGDLNWFR